MKPLYTISGIVHKGKQRGKALGFPTANIDCTTTIPSGIYVSLTKINDQKYPSVTFIGDAKTFRETLFQAETYVLDFSQDIYQQPMTVMLLQKIRENQFFPSVALLQEQMEKDVQATQGYFQTRTINEVEA